MRQRRLLALMALPCAFLLFPSSSVAAPSCAEGPETVGTTIIGTPCADTIRMPRSVTTVLGEGGDDVLYGQRGNDSIFGGEGNDRLYGGVGDDRLRGGPGDDRLSGGFGADSLDGEEGNDFDRGDATIDNIADSGEGGNDTLSFATGATPGFPNTGAFFTDRGFPAGAEGRGVFVDLGKGFANDGAAPSGGGFDEPFEPDKPNPLDPETDFSHFETVIGTPFPDYIVGTSGKETFYGGGGADLIDGGGGGDVAHGGADEDGCVNVATDDCELSSEEIKLRNPGTIAVGVMAPGGPGGPAAYLTGSNKSDRVTASYGSGAVTFTLAAGSEGQFDATEAIAGGCSAPIGSSVSCPVSETPDSILFAGLGGDDVLSAPGLPEAVSVVVLGNEGDDSLTGGETEDALVDGAGDDTVNGAGRDDALPNNGGADQLRAGAGEDLFISNAVCNGDLLDGGGDRDNANWANFGSGVTIDMAQHVAGLIGPQGEARCNNTDELTSLQAIEDIEATNGGDNLIGDDGPNQLLGRDGPDNFFAGAGNDLLLVNSGDSDPTVDCGEGFDTALIDFVPIVDGPPVNCESVEERAPNSFRPPDTPPNPNPEPEKVEPPPPPPPPPPKRDRTPPATLLRHHPAALLFTSRPRLRVFFAFGASEAGAGFHCKLDGQPWRLCRSPRSYRVAPGRHTFRVFAIDAAGNHDRSPAVFKFRVRSRES